MTHATQRRTKSQQTEHTVRALIAAARPRFAREGYAAVSLAALTRAAGVTKGAVYHHFGSKAGLFRAVVAQVQHDVADRVARAAGATDDPWQQLADGCAAFLAASRDAEVQRIMLIDAPAVLGWSEWIELDRSASARHLTEALTTLIGQGIITERPVEPLARLLSGAMNEAALWLADTDRPGALDETTEALLGLLESLRRPQPPTGADD